MILYEISCEFHMKCHFTMSSCEISHEIDTNEPSAPSYGAERHKDSKHTSHRCDLSYGLK